MQDINIEVIDAEAGHLEALIDLGGDHYAKGHAALDARFLTWFYLDNPAGRAKLVVASEGGLWVGLIVLIPVPLSEFGQKSTAFFAVNVLTRPSHRGKSLFVKMIRAAKDVLAEGGNWLLGHPNGNALPGWKRQKMQFRPSLKLFLAKFASPFSGVKTRRIRTIDELRALPQAIWSESSSGIGIRRSAEWLFWRFLAAPHRQYDVRAVSVKGDIVGVRITRQFKFGVDLMVDWVGASSNSQHILGHTLRPTLIMHPGGSSTPGWRLPSKRELPFFMSTWNDSTLEADLADITLAASDF